MVSAAEVNFIWRRELQVLQRESGINIMFYNVNSLFL